MLDGFFNLDQMLTVSKSLHGLQIKIGLFISEQKLLLLPVFVFYPFCFGDSILLT